MALPFQVGGAQVNLDARGRGQRPPAVAARLVQRCGVPKQLLRPELDAAPDPVARRLELVEEYTERYANPYIAAERGYVDDVIDPADTRRVLALGLSAAMNAPIAETRFGVFRM